MSIVLLVLGFVAVQAKDTRGYHSEFFDMKYKPNSETLITPVGQPTLFAFTGRWHRYSELYTASVWPGTYVSLLTFGDNCTLVLKPHIKEYTNLTYVVTVDGGEPFEVSTAVTMEDLKHEVLLAIDTSASAYKDGSPVDETIPPDSISSRAPHVVKVTSSRHGFPLSLKGYYIPTAIVRQYSDWIDYQSVLPYVEFVGGPAHIDERFALTSAEYKAAEELSIRHSHITTPDCFSKCGHKSRSLARQYPRLSPVIFDPFYKQEYHHSGLYSFHESKPLQISTPGYIVIDVGDEDLREQVPGTVFADDLYTFIKYVHYKANPDAFIILVVKPGRYDKEVKNVVKHFNNSKIFTAASPSSPNVAGWRRFLQKNVLTLTPSSARYRNALITYKDHSIVYDELPKPVRASGAGSGLYVLMILLVLGGLIGLVFVSHAVRSVLFALLLKTGVVTIPKQSSSDKGRTWE
ncbi:hypothetical protein V1512DRAFT_209982 [Lipomyces arxii]|uniref:uncharacterized protein n=1 Tax=Lipomyces arxii TaxID=56418 RepID=UPI0034CE7B76